MMLQLKSFGYNCIRCSHNPYSDSFARIADRVGMLVVDELTDKWSDNDYWAAQPFTHIWHKLITEWIKRDRNRPSIICGAWETSFRFVKDGQVSKGPTTGESLPITYSTSW